MNDLLIYKLETFKREKHVKEILAENILLSRFRPAEIPNSISEGTKKDGVFVQRWDRWSPTTKGRFNHKWLLTLEL